MALVECIGSINQIAFGIYLSHSKTTDEITTSPAIQGFKDEFEGLLFKKEIQAPRTRTIGWGVYSTPSTDGNKLQEYFKRQYNLTLSC